MAEDEEMPDEVDEAGEDEDLAVDQDEVVDQDEADEVEGGMNHLV